MYYNYNGAIITVTVIVSIMLLAGNWVIRPRKDDSEF